MKRLKILLVDDSVENLHAMYTMFQELYPEHTILQSNDPLIAFRIACQSIPDIIITDWEMPAKTGIELIRELQEIPVTRNIPVIVATGIRVTSSDLSYALESGAMDFIRKPLDPVELYARIHSVLTIAEEHRKSLDEKNNELIKNAMEMAKTSEILDDILNDLRNLVIRLSGEEKQMAESIMEKVFNTFEKESWKRLNNSFQNIHPTFLSNLSGKHPNLTPTENRLCILIRLGMNIKEIATLLYQSPDSIKVMRARLRKKIEIQKDQNLESYLQAF
jgi:response regulator RpfG family c-di-GMP phosphodiesterase/DNA-binding CsgD family transcriptional regulator